MYRAVPRHGYLASDQVFIMPSIDIFLDLTPSQCLQHYTGTAQWVQARSTDGRRVQFPARALSQVVTKDGAVGQFRLTFSDEGRFMSIQRVGI